MSKHIVVFDIGTGSGRAVVFDGNGRQVAAAQSEWLPATIPGVPGSQIFDVDEAWTILGEMSRRAITRSAIDTASIVATTATSMREGMVLYDSDSNELWACPNVDGRASAEAEDLIQDGSAKRIYEVGGDWVSITSPARFRWIAKHEPQILKSTAAVNMLSDWLLFKLCNRIITDASIGSSSGVFDLTERNWSDELIELVGVDRSIFPEVVESGTIIGEVDRAAAAATGIPAGTLVVTAGADTQMALIGSGITDSGRLGVVGGTFWQTTVSADRPLVDPGVRLRTLCHALPGMWMTEGIGFFHGFSMRWFRDAFCEMERNEAQERGCDPYFVMEERAASVPPGSNGVVAALSAPMNARRWRHPSPGFLGFDILDAERSGKAACIRSIEENAAYVSRSHVETLAMLTDVDDSEVVFSGGSSKGFLWPQILADVLRRAVKIPTVKESAALGSFIMAATAVGLYGNVAQAADASVRWDRTVEPDLSAADAYDDLYPKWQRLYESHLLPIVDSGALPPMWAAPGAGPTVDADTR